MSDQLHSAMRPMRQRHRQPRSSNMHRLLQFVLCVSWLLVMVRADVEAGSITTGSGSTDLTSPPPTTTAPPTTTPPPTTPPPTTTKPTTTKPPPTTTPPPTPPSGDGSGTPEPTTPPPTTQPPTDSPAPSTNEPSTIPPDSDSGSGSGSGAGSTSDGSFNSSSNKGDVTNNNKTPGETDDTSSTKYAIVVAVAIVACVVLFGLIFVRRRLQQKKEEADKDLQAELDRLDLERGPGAAAYTVAGVGQNQFQNQIQSRPLEGSFHQRQSQGYNAYDQRPSDPRVSGSSSYGAKNSTSRSPASWSSSWTTVVGSMGGGDRDSLSAVWKDPDILAARIPFEKIIFRNVVTRGGFGEVFEGVYHGQRVAIKRLLPENRRRMACLEEFLKEAQLLSSLEHERIVQFIGVAWDSPRDLCIVLEYMTNGDLRNTLTLWRQEGQKTGWNDVRKVRIALHIAEALTYLHTLSPKIVHRDLKSKNVLLTEHWQAKLTDFGVSREESSRRTMTSNVGSSLWIAPEVMVGSNYDEKADIFSFGIVLTELDSMQLPYHNAVSPDGRKLPDAAVLHMVTMGKIQAEFSAMSRTDMVLLGRACLNVDPALRPNAGEVRYRLAQILGTY